MANKLRLGIIGTGVAARRLYLPAFQKLGRRLEVVAVTNRTRRKATAFAKLLPAARVVASAEELLALPNVDAVLVSLPIDSQPDTVELALAANKPVLSEKPIAPTVARARRLIRYAARCSVPWLVGENYAFMPAVERVQSWVASGRLGALRIVEARQLTRVDARNPYFKTAWRAEPQHPGGYVLDGGVHLAHALRRVVGEPASVRSWTCQFDAALKPIDTAVAALTFEGGAVGTWTSCFATCGSAPMLRLFGSRGSAELTTKGARLVSSRGKETCFESQVDSIEAQFSHFADVVVRGAELRFTPEEALKDLRLIESVVGRSARSGSPARPRARRAAPELRGSSA